MAPPENPAKRLKRAARSIELTPRGWVFVIVAFVSLAAAHVLTIPTFNYVASLLAGLVLCAATFVIAGHSRVNISRSFSPEVVAQGQPAEATVTVTNLSALPSIGANWEDHLPVGVVGDAHGVLSALGGGRSRQARTRFTYTVHGVRRGSHPIGPLTILVNDPFGLVRRGHVFGDPHELIVLPKRVELSSISFGGAVIAGASKPAPQHVGVGEEDVIARNYLPGDALRRMHWKATAHRGEFMVRQEEQHNNPEATVLLDLDAFSQGTARDRQGQWEYSPTFEWAIVAAASVTSHLCRRRYLVNVLTPGGPMNRSISEGMDTIHDVMTDLAIIDPTDVSAEDIRAIAPSERPCVAVLGCLDDVAAAAWSRLNSSTGLAFVAAGTSGAAIDILADSGWKVRVYRPGDDLAALWLDLDARDFHAAR